MPAYWLTYKPLTASADRGWPAAKLTELVQRFKADPDTTTLWRIVAHRAAKVGDRVYLFKQGVGPRGIFGVGTIADEPGIQGYPNDIDKAPTSRARIKFDRLVDPSHEFLLEYDLIKDFVDETLIAAQASGTSVADDVAVELEKRLFLRPLGDEEADDVGFDPDKIKDQRERALRAIRVRRGQPAFRAALLEAYGGRCSISGCSVKDVLEAAHITSYLGDLTNDVSNGLLLRSDLHTLFDCYLLAIEPETRKVVIAEALKSSTYAQLAGKELRRPNRETKGPSKRNLEIRFGLFEDALKARVEPR